MIDLKLNGGRLRDHWHSYRAQYFVAAIVAGLAAWLLFSVTTPRIPYDKRVDVVIYSNNSSSIDIDKWEAELASLLPADQNVSIQLSPMVNDLQMSQLVVARISAGQEGTIWILPADYFQLVAGMGAFMPLEDKLGSLNLPQGIDMTAGKAALTSDEGQPANPAELYGIPLDSFKGLSAFFDPTGMVLAFPTYAEDNWDNAVTAANWLFSKTELK